MKKKLCGIIVIALFVSVLLGGSGLLGDTIGAAIGLISLTILLLWAVIYSIKQGEFKGKKKIISVVGLVISCCAVFWWGVGSLIWPENTALRAVSFCLALPAILMMRSSKLVSIDGVPFRIQFPGLPPIIVNIIIIGLILGGVFIGFRSCSKQSMEKEYLESLENVEVEVFDKYFNESTDKFDFAIRVKNGTPYALTNMRFEMKVYDETGALLVSTSFYIPEGSAFATGEERRFYAYVKQSDVESVETLYYADFDSLNIQMWITEVEYEEYDSPLSTEYQCFNKSANP